MKLTETSEVEKKIWSLIWETPNLTMDEIVAIMYIQYKTPERLVKEAIQRMRYNGRVEMTNQWDLVARVAEDVDHILEY